MFTFSLRLEVVELKCVLRELTRIFLLFASHLPSSLPWVHTVVVVVVFVFVVVVVVVIAVVVVIVLVVLFSCCLC